MFLNNTCIDEREARVARVAKAKTCDKFTTIVCGIVINPHFNCFIISTTINLCSI